MQKNISGFKIAFFRFYKILINLTFYSISYLIIEMLKSEKETFECTNKQKDIHYFCLSLLRARHHSK